MPPAEPAGRPASPSDADADRPTDDSDDPNTDDTDNRTNNANGTSPAPMSAEEQRKSLLAAVGGGRGALETSLPGLVFVTIFAFRHDVRLGAIVAGALGVVLLLIRVARKETTQYAIGGFVGVVIAGLFAVSTGKAANYFLPSILKNLGFALLYLVSVVVRWPLLGVLLGPLLKENFAWRKHDARRKAYAQATLIWTAMFAIRLAVQLPLFLLDQTVALGVANVVLSWPLFAVVAWATWVVIRRVPPVPASDDQDAPDRA